MQFVRVCSIDDIAESSMRRVTVDGLELLLAHYEGQFFALGEKCTHRGGPLSEGTLEDGVVTCPWHFGQFDIKTGRVLGPPPPEPLQKFELKVEEGVVLVSVP